MNYTIKRLTHEQIYGKIYDIIEFYVDDNIKNHISDTMFPYDIMHLAYYHTIEIIR